MYKIIDGFKTNYNMWDTSIIITCNPCRLWWNFPPPNNLAQLSYGSFQAAVLWVTYFGTRKCFAYIHTIKAYFPILVTHPPPFPLAGAVMWQTQIQSFTAHNTKLCFERATCETKHDHVNDGSLARRQHIGLNMHLVSHGISNTLPFAI